MSQNNYNELLDIITLIKKIKITEPQKSKNLKTETKTKILILDFDEKTNIKKILKSKNLKFIISSIHFKIKITSYLNDIINDYLLGKMIEYISLDKQEQSNIQNLISYYNFVLLLKSNHNQTIITKIQNFDFKSLRIFLKFMNKEIIFNIKKASYKDLTNLSKIFLIKIDKGLKYLINYKLNSKNIYCDDNIDLLYNIFIMIFYILIKNPY